MRVLFVIFISSLLFSFSLQPMAKETRTEPTTLKAHSADSLMAVSVGGKEAVEKLRTFKSFRAEGRALLSGASATFGAVIRHRTSL